VDFEPARRLERRERASEQVFFAQLFGPFNNVTKDLPSINIIMIIDVHVVYNIRYKKSKYFPRCDYR